MTRKQYRKHALVVIASLFMMFPQQLWAQSEKSLTLDEAIRLSLQNSKQLKLSNAKVDEATAALREARENRLPDVKASGAFMRLNQPNINLKTGGSSSGNDTSSSSSSSGGISVHQIAYGMVNASLPLFAGFKIDYGIKSAKYLAKAEQLDAEQDKQAVIENTINAYNNLYKAQKAVELVKENLKQSKQRVQDFTNMEQNGVLAKNDLLKAELQESNVSLSLLDAQNNYDIANINMDLMLGLPENTVITPDMPAETGEPTDDKTITDWETMALQNRKDLQALDFRQKAAMAGVSATKGDYFPSVAITGGYIAADIPNLVTITNALNVGVGLQYNLGSLWKTGAKVAQAKARVAQLDATAGVMNDRVRIEISKAYKNYLVSKKKIQVYEIAVDQAEENYKITKSKYDNSLATTTDLLDADVAQLQARLNYEYSKGDALVAYKKLLETAGVLTFEEKK